MFFDYIKFVVGMICLYTKILLIVGITYIVIKINIIIFKKLIDR